MVGKYAALGLCVAMLGGAVANAQTQTVFMVQLGSFDSENEAQQRWQSLKNANPAILGNLSPRLREVTLPPDNFTVYRTQAGPLGTRQQAQAICSQLLQRGDECFVIETAMVRPPAGTMQADSASTPRLPIKTDPSAQASAAASQAASVAAHSATNAANAAGTTLANAPRIAPAVPEIPAIPEVSRPTPPNIAYDNSSDTEEEEGFFSGFWPFGGDDEAEQQQADAREINQALDRALINTQPAASNEALQPLQLEPEVQEPQRPRPIMTPQRSAPPAPIPAPVQAANAEPAYRLPPPPDSSGQAATSPLLNAPVPAPRAPQMARRDVPDSPRIAVPPAPAAASTVRALGTTPPIDQRQPRTLAELQQSVPQPAPQPAPQYDMRPAAANSGADVDVAEAIRVPLSEQTAPQPRIQTVPAQAALRAGLPSQNLRQKTLWAQVSYFRDQQSALSYWEQFRLANPEFPPVRVRVTRPYQLNSSRAARVSLRIGPFETANYITQMCNALPLNNLRCSVVSDLGTSAVANTPRYRQTYRRYDQRYANGLRPNTLGASRATNWVQLGSYVTPGQAELAWQQLQQAHPQLLGSLQRNIMSPALSSSTRAQFRLRTGPYAVAGNAEQLCDQLRRRGVSCLVSSGQ